MLWLVLLACCVSSTCGLVMPVARSVHRLSRPTCRGARPQLQAARSERLPQSVHAPLLLAAGSRLSSAVGGPHLSEYIRSSWYRSAIASLTSMATDLRIDFVRATLSHQHLVEHHAPSSVLTVPLDALSQAVCSTAFPLRYRVVCEWHEERAKQAEMELENAHAQLRRALASEFGEDVENLVDLSARIKSPLSIFEKSVLRGKHVSDFLGIRLVVNESGDAGASTCYSMAKAIASLWPGVRMKDYIQQPKANGYQSLHILAPTRDGVQVEIQIRTAEMHEKAESGDAAHALYKASGAIPRRESAQAHAPAWEAYF